MTAGSSIWSLARWYASTPFVGEAQGETKITDAVSGQILGE
jgi:hypothetical protein